MDELINDYYDFLKSQTNTIKLNEYYEITVPLYDFIGDAIQIYAKFENNNIYMDDDGNTIGNLKMNGVGMSPNRIKQIERTWLTFGAQFDGDNISIRTTKDKFSNRLNSLIQCILRVDDMNFTTSSKVKSYFLDDVVKYFNKNDIYYTENPSFIGKSGYTSNFDFLFQRSKNKPERLCKLINNASKSTIKMALFEWDDTRPMRKNDTKFIVLINDSNNVDDSIYDATANYGVQVVNWSKIDDSINLFR